MLKENKGNKGATARIEVPCAGGLTLVAEKGSDPGCNEIFITLEKDGDWFCDLALAGQDYSYGQDNRVENDPSCFRVCVWGDTAGEPADDFTDEIRVHVDAAPEPSPTLEEVRAAYGEYARWRRCGLSHTGSILFHRETGQVWADCLEEGGSKVYHDPEVVRVPAEALLWQQAGRTVQGGLENAMAVLIHHWIHGEMAGKDTGPRESIPEKEGEYDTPEEGTFFTDPEYRLLLAALSRETEVCRKTDKESPGEVNLERLMDSISRKIADMQYGRKGASE